MYTFLSERVRVEMEGGLFTLEGARGIGGIADVIAGACYGWIFVGSESTESMFSIFTIKA